MWSDANKTANRVVTTDHKQVIKHSKNRAQIIHSHKSTHVKILLNFCLSQTFYVKLINVQTS